MIPVFIIDYTIISLRGHHLTNLNPQELIIIIIVFFLNHRLVSALEITLDMTVVGVGLVTMALVALSHRFFLDNLLLPTCTNSDWAEFIDIILLSRSFDSGYMVVLEEAVPGTTNLSMTNISLYNLYVWMNHYAAKDAFTKGKL